MAETAEKPGVTGNSEQATVTDDEAVAAAAAAATKLADEKAAAEKGTQEQRPAWLPEKFKTAEEMAASYAELEKKQSTTETTKPASAADLLIETKEVKPDDAIDMTALEEEYSKNDGLTDKTYTALAKRGLSRADADSIIEGRVAQGLKIRADMAGLVGGEDMLQKTLAWAKDNSDKSELDAYNAAVKSKSVGSISLALKGLHAGFIADGGTPPNLVEADGIGGAGVTTFEDSEQMIAAMADPRYKSSPTYRKEVQARIAGME